MHPTIIKVINIICYAITAAFISFALWIGIAAGDSPEGQQYDQCMQTARDLAPDADTKLLIQRGCLGNYMISFGKSIQQSQ